MSFFGFKKFPAPVAKPMMPFFAAGIVVMYGINSFAHLVATSDSFDFKDDPRNNFIEKKPAAEKH